MAASSAGHLDLHLRRIGSKGCLSKTGRAARWNARLLLDGSCLSRRALIRLHLLSLRLAILIKMMPIVRVLAVLALRALPTFLDVEAELIWEFHSPSSGLGLCLCLSLRLSFLTSTSLSCTLREIILLGMGICTLAFPLDELLDGLRIMAETTRITPCARAFTLGFTPANVSSSRLFSRSALRLCLRLGSALFRLDPTLCTEQADSPAP